jgi:subfamily B ATP-binding cassette protein MsbA
LFIAPTFTLFALFIGLCFFITLKGLNNSIAILSRKNVEDNVDLSNLFSEIIKSWKYLSATKSLYKVDPFLKKSIDEITSNQYNFGKATALIQSFREPIIGSGLILVTLFYVSYLGQNFSTILVSLLLIHKILNAVLSSQTTRLSYLENIGGLEIINTTLADAQESYQSISRANQRLKFDNDETEDNDIIIRCENVSFKNIFQNLNFSIRRGETITVAGPSGAGKTTLLDLLLEVKDVDSGVIRKRLNLDAEHRYTVGYVTQTVPIFNDTILNNITLWQEPDFVDLNKINLVLDICQLQPLVNEMRDGINTVISTLSTNISGGQAQRLALARELYKGPDLLLLDEATGALDPTTEDKVINGLNKFFPDLTIINIAHRASILEQSDKTLFLEPNSPVIFDTFEKLMSDSFYFRTMFGKRVK